MRTQMSVPLSIYRPLIHEAERPCPLLSSSRCTLDLLLFCMRTGALHSVLDAVEGEIPFRLLQFRQTLRQVLLPGMVAAGTEVSLGLPHQSTESSGYSLILGAIADHWGPAEHGYFFPARRGQPPRAVHRIRPAAARSPCDARLMRPGRQPSGSVLPVEVLESLWQERPRQPRDTSLAAVDHSRRERTARWTLVGGSRRISRLRGPATHSGGPSRQCQRRPSSARPRSAIYPDRLLTVGGERDRDLACTLQ